jgi:glycosyltransferase involved in cell wall biosynthesis
MYKTIYYTASVQSSFVRKDKDLLRKHFRLIDVYFNAKFKWYIPLQLVKQFFTLLFNSKNADIFITQFGGYHSLMPGLIAKLFGKPYLIILGGADCVSFPSINYGNFRKSPLKQFTCWSYLLATHLSPVDESLVLGPYTYTNHDYEEQGLLKFCPNTKAVIKVLNYGYNPEEFFPGETRVPNSFIMVGYLKHANYYRKGVDLIIGLAKANPDYKFTIVGGTKKDIPYKEIPENVRFISSVSYSELKSLYAKHEFYLQLSICEGFPSSICEAMLCGCIPIGSNVAAIPKIIGNAGFILMKKDINELEVLVKKAVACKKTLFSNHARNQIMTNFPKNEREKLILLINTILNVG